MKKICTLLTLMVLPGLAFAGEDPLALLRQLEGDWQVTYTQIDESGEYKDVGTSTSHFSVKLEGKLVQEETLIKTSSRDFPLLVNYSYDFARKVYRKASIDAVSGLMDIQEGALNEGRLYLTNTKYQTWFIGQSGHEIAFRITFDLSRPDHPQMTADLSRDYGLTWLPFQKLYYKRATATAGEP
jgi:hypothetical protein